MREPLSILEGDVRALANHNMRHLHAIRQHVDAVISKLEGHRQAGRVHLWQPAADPSSEMDIVVGVARDLKEKLAFLGCYYCLQFLRMSLGSLDSLRLRLAAPADRSSIERAFMLKTGGVFRTLSAAYMRKLLDLSLENRETPAYAIIGVGTKADLEDIDIGVIDAGGAGRENLNEAIAQMSSEMLRYATSLHFHLSEHVGKRGYTASIREYEAALTESVSDFVITSELLGGALITGDAALFHEFQTTVVSPYYYRPGRDQTMHEGYLRGMLGELRSLLGRPLASERIYPKDDGLRTIKGLLSVLKTIYQVGEVNAWMISDALKRRIPEHEPALESLERSLSFLEVFRFVYQLVVAQDEEIFLDDEVMQANIDSVARVLGYRQVGTIRPGTQLLVDYYENIENVRTNALSLFPLCTDHLKRTTIFADIFSPSFSGNVAQDFARRSERFRGTTFWRDVLETLEAEDNAMLRRYVADLDTLPDETRRSLIDDMAERADYALGTVMGVIVLLSGSRDCEGCMRLLDELSDAFSTRLSNVPYAGFRLIELFYRRPRLMNRYLLSQGDAAVQLLTSLLETEIWDPEVILWRDRLKHLLDVHTDASRYFQRFLDRAGDAYPACLTQLDDQSALEDVSRGVLAAAEVEEDSVARKKLLGEYYDIEFLRIGLGTLSGERSPGSDAKFTRMADNYIDDLFQTCKLEVDRDESFRVATHDLLAVYATGGLGREQAYDDDFDLMILLNTDHREVKAYAAKIVAKMNVEIIKRGALPHYRFSDHFGEYVTTLSELESLLDGEVRDSFIDRSQMLEARMIVGTRRFADVYWRRIIKGHLFTRRLEYVRSMRHEIASRHADAQASGMGSADVKDGIGGLRDIVMLLLMYKAAFRLRHPVNAGLFPIIALRAPQHRENLSFLSGALEFLKDLRNAYRLTVGAEDRLDREYFDVVANAMRMDLRSEPHPGERLLGAYGACASRVAETVDVLALDLETSLTGEAGGN